MGGVMEVTIEAKPSPELKKLCKYWIPFLQQKHIRYGHWRDKELAIGHSGECMVAEAYNWDHEYTTSCNDCREFANVLDLISVNNRGMNITPVQVNRMIRKGNAFASHYMKRHMK